MRDIHLIPYSSKVLERYKSLVIKLKDILDEMIKNRMECIKRKIDRVFPKNYPEDSITSEEVRAIQSEIDRLNRTYPATEIPNPLNYNVDMTDIKDKIPWYFETY
jgi:hypothetical protein